MCFFSVLQKVNCRNWGPLYETRAQTLLIWNNRFVCSQYFWEYPILGEEMLMFFYLKWLPICCISINLLYHNRKLGSHFEMITFLFTVWFQTKGTRWMESKVCGVEKQSSWIERKTWRASALSLWFTNRRGNSQKFKRNILVLMSFVLK